MINDGFEHIIRRLDQIIIMIWATDQLAKFEDACNFFIIHQISDDKVTAVVYEAHCPMAATVDLITIDSLDKALSDEDHGDCILSFMMSSISFLPRVFF
jgi:hypothetical protein